MRDRQPKGRKPIGHEEHNIQVGCVTWFRLTYPQWSRLLFAVPNGGRRDAKAGKMLKAEGVVAGVADLLLLLPNGKYHGLCIEMKTSKGAQSQSQKQWQKEVEEAGYLYLVVRNIEDFMREITDYINERQFHF